MHTHLHDESFFSPLHHLLQMYKDFSMHDMHSHFLLRGDGYFNFGWFGIPRPNLPLHDPVLHKQQKANIQWGTWYAQMGRKMITWWRERCNLLAFQSTGRWNPRWTVYNEVTSQSRYNINTITPYFRPPPPRPTIYPISVLIKTWNIRYKSNSAE